MSIDGQGILQRRNIAENFNRMSRAHERYRQTTDDRQTTDGRTTTYSEHMNLSSRSLKNWLFNEPKTYNVYVSPRPHMGLKNEKCHFRPKFKH